MFALDPKHVLVDYTERLENRTVLTPTTLTVEPGDTSVSTIQEGGSAILKVRVNASESSSYNVKITAWGDTGTSTSMPVAGTSATIAPNGTFSFWHWYMDDPAGTSDQYAITIEHTPVAGTGSTSSTATPSVTTATATVVNVDPEVTAHWVPSDVWPTGTTSASSPTSLTIHAGDTLVVSGQIRDPGPMDDLTLTIDWGTFVETATAADLNAVSSSSFSGQLYSFSFSHQYTGTAITPLVLSASVNDGDGGTGTQSLSLTILPDPAPTFDTVNWPSGRYDEDTASVTVSGTIRDNRAGQVTVKSIWGDGNSSSSTITLNDTGSGSATGTFNIWYRYDDDNPTSTSSDQYAITIQATDDTSTLNVGATTAATPITVDNVAPQISLNSNTSTLAVGEALTLSGSFNDVGSSDTLTLTIS